MIQVLAVSEGCDTDPEVRFLRVDLKQQLRVKPGPRTAVQIVGGAVMSYEELRSWLVELSYKLAVLLDQPKSPVILQRPRPVKLKAIRVGWVGPEIG